MREQILKLMDECPDHRFSAEEISAHLHVQGSAQHRKMMWGLNALEDELTLARDEKEGYQRAERLGHFQGRLRVNAKGFGFIDRDEVSYYVAREHLCLGMDNDLVLARILQGGGHETECEVVRILEHGSTKFVGVVKKDRKSFYFLPDKDLGRRRITVSNYAQFPLVHDSEGAGGDRLIRQRAERTHHQGAGI